MLKIQTWETNEILRTISEDIKKEEFWEYIKLGKQMIKFIKDPKNWWVWLAAPQIWINKNLIVVSLLRDRDDEWYKTILMINPKILEYSSETNFEKEWCLSVPWAKGLVERSNEIKLSFIDESKKEQIFYFKWLSARIIQHEVDHLNWILFIDKVVEKSKILTF